MKLKKMTALLMAAAMCLGLAACGGTEETSGKQPAEAMGEEAERESEAEAESSGNSDEVITLDMWHIWAAESESSKIPFESAVAEFNAENPNIQVKLDATENETYKTKMVTTIAANEAPDIYYYWSAGYMKNVVEAGKALALNDYLDDEVMAKIVPGTLENVTFDDKIYGLGACMTVTSFFVNTQMFEENNIKIPETWDELIDACNKFNSLGITPMTIGAKEAWCIDMYLDLILTRAAGYEACNNALGKTGSYVTDGMIEGAERLQELVEIGAFDAGALGISRDESEVPFYNGEVPMYINGSWTIGNLMRDDCKIKDVVDIVRFPVINDNSDINDFVGGAPDCFIVNADTEYPEECVYALTEIMEKFSKNAYEAGVGLPTWNVEADESKINPLTRKLVSYTGEASNFLLYWNNYLEGEDAEVYMRKAQELFACDITPEQFANDLQTMNE